jgi:phage-related protein
MMKMCQVRFPAFASWWHAAKHEMLSFPVGKHDDFIAALSEIGRCLESMTRPTPVVEGEGDEAILNRGLNQPWRPDHAWLRRQHELAESNIQPRYGDR